MRCSGGIVIAGQSAPVVDDDLRLKRPNHLKQRLRVPVFGRAAQTVEPHDVDPAVVGEKLSDLAVEEADVLGVVFRAIVRVVPVDRRVVNTPPEPGFVAGVGQLFDHVAAERRFGARDLVVGEPGIEHAEAVVVLGGEHHVSHAGGFGGLGPLAGVELDGIEPLVEIVVDLDGDRALASAAPPFAPARPADLGALEAHRPPVHEQAELELPPLGDDLRPGAQVLLGRFLRGRLGRRAGRRRNEEERRHKRRHQRRCCSLHNDPPQRDLILQPPVSGQRLKTSL
jgi:hypothetical protein